MQKQDHPWHALSIEEVYQKTQSSPNGLTAEEVDKRKKIYGPNKMTPAKKKSFLQRFLHQFHNLLIYVLLVAALLTAFLEHWIDSGVILGVVMVNALIGVVQEGKAEKAIDAIRKMLSIQAMVRREGKFNLIESEELVPGDIVSLQSGDKIPADIRLSALKELRVDEAILTGESVPVQKSLEHLGTNTPIAERSCMVYSGTLVTFGTATGLVVSTAEQTQIGQISTMLRDVQTLTTPLLRQVGKFAKWLTAAIIILATITFAFGILVHEYSTVDMFMASVGLAVAAIPEGLPAIMTITLAIGVQEMAIKKAIIRRLPAVETLGAVTVICSDKTGTLTKNQMTVRSIVTPEQSFTVSGSGYNPHGNFYLDKLEVDLSDYPELLELSRSAMLCNDASVHQEGSDWNLVGDPTEGALVVLGMKSGLEPSFEHEQRPRTDVIPFESQHGYMATLHHDHEGHGFIYVKGSPERIIEMSSIQNKDFWHAQVEKIAEQGERVLALALKKTDERQTSLHFDEIQEGLILLGIVGMIDPPREEAIQAVKDCRSAGIRVKMITGEHLKTASAIGQSMGIGNGEKSISGEGLDKLSDQELRKTVNDIHIFARTTPEQKLRIVTALQANENIVAMTGDGVNDAPALKRADVGIAMGINGTEVSKESAEIVLADDNFATIARAVKEGRTVYDNLKKSILFILPTNGGEALIIIAAILMGRMLPITPVQILWVNMITAVTLALTLAFESTEEDVMTRPPRDPNAVLLSPMLIWRIVFVSVILMVGTFGLFIWYRDQGSSIEEARTIAVNTLVAFEIFYLFNVRQFFASAFSLDAFKGNKYVLYACSILIVFQLFFTYAPPMQVLFQTTYLSAVQWLHIILVASSVFFLVEFEKWMARLRRT